MKNPQYSSQERVSQTTSPLMQRHSTKTTSVDYCSNRSTIASSSVPSRTSSRNSATSDPKPAERVQRDKDNKKTSEAYLITFEAETPKNDLKEQKEKASRKSLKEVKVKIPSNKEETNGNRQMECYTVTSLKEQLEVHRPEFIRNAEERQKCLEELVHLRALRQATRRKLLHFNLVTHQNLQKEKQDMPKQKSAPAKPISKSSGRQKENSEPICLREKRRLKRALPEYQKKEAEQRKKQYYQTNRLLADIYSKKLQKKVLNGAVSLSMSESVISTL
ncbi:hypothetical protein J437_LFUL011691 [Ladona fulva]|uniref:ALMS motif domain-containing protein n=1 Tax=Ladona fulva TaxID=123851 RepID=A0A8K0JTU2_LADFU|nr:hypothetical protein J437_LFUL011691 [Ladona fulva]